MIITATTKVQKYDTEHPVMGNPEKGSSILLQVMVAFTDKIVYSRVLLFYLHNALETITYISGVVVKCPHASPLRQYH